MEQEQKDMDKEQTERIVKDMETEQTERMKKYDAEFTQHVMAKYFSDKTVFGGNIFDAKMTIGGETLKAGRFPGYLSYADPANFGDRSILESTSAAETPTDVSNDNHPAKSS